jgi:hypothetical protein
MLLGRLEHLVEGVGLLDRHQPPPHVGAGARDRQRQPHLGPLAGQPQDARGHPRRAHRDRPRVDGHRAGLAQHPDRLEHPLDVRERLAHPLEHHPVHPLPHGSIQAPPHDPHLLDDLPGLEVAPQPQPARGAERARQGAPHLRADACREPPCPLERDAHRLDALAVPRLQQELPEGVEAARPVRQRLEPVHHARCPHRLDADAPDPLQGRARRLVAVDRRDDLPGLGERHRGDALDHSLGCQGLQRDHGRSFVPAPGPGRKPRPLSGRAWPRGRRPRSWRRAATICGAPCRS